VRVCVCMHAFMCAREYTIVFVFVCVFVCVCTCEREIKRESM